MPPRRLSHALASALLFAAPALSIRPAEAAETTPYELRLATIAPVHSSWGERFRVAKAEILQRTDGRVKLNVYAGGVLGDEIDVVRKMNLGQVDGAAFVSQGISKMVPSLQVFNLPYLYRTPEEFTHIQKAFFPRAQKILQDQGLVLITWGEIGGFVQLYSSRPIKSREDLQKSKIWGWTDEPISLEGMQVTGLTPVVLPFTQVFPGLQTGMIDALFGTSLAVLVMNWYRYLKHAVRMNVAYPQALVFVTGKSMAKIRAEDRAVIMEVLNRDREAIIEQLRKDDRKAEDGLRQHGMEFTDAPPEIMEQVRRDVSKLWDRLSGSLFPPELLRDILAELDKYRASQRT
ncbi:MAG: TRAP transporter substrate-binding protein DctP [Nitrospirae bacterium]|nr:TRAP transporter substrate-binding protein DctP [Nitrospirota bacterium]